MLDWLTWPAKDLFDFGPRGGVEVDLMSPEIRLELKDRGVQVL